MYVILKIDLIKIKSIFGTDNKCDLLISVHCYA